VPPNYPIESIKCRCGYDTKGVDKNKVVELEFLLNKKSEMLGRYSNSALYDLIDFAKEYLTSHISDATALRIHHGTRAEYALPFMPSIIDFTKETYRLQSEGFVFFYHYLKRRDQLSDRGWDVPNIITTGVKAELTSMTLSDLEKAARAHVERKVDGVLFLYSSI